MKREQQTHLDTLKVIRWAGYMQYVMNRDSKKRLLRPEELLYIDEPKEKKKVELPSREEMETMRGWIKKK